MPIASETITAHFAPHFDAAARRHTALPLCRRLTTNR
jgi:hypothetical protein